MRHHGWSERTARRGAASVPAAARAREPRRLLRVLGTRIGGSAPKPCTSSGCRDGHHRCERPTPRRLLRGRRPILRTFLLLSSQGRGHRVVHIAHRRRASGDDGPLSGRHEPCRSWEFHWATWRMPASASSTCGARKELIDLHRAVDRGRSRDAPNRDSRDVSFCTARRFTTSDVTVAWRPRCARSRRTRRCACRVPVS